MSVLPAGHFMPLTEAENLKLETFVNRFCDSLPAPSPEDRPLLADAKSALLTGFVLLAHATGADVDALAPKTYVDGLEFAIDTIKSWEIGRISKLDIELCQAIASDIVAEKLRVENLVS